MRRKKILIGLFNCLLGVLPFIYLTSCVKDYFVDETNYRLYFPAIEANGEIDKNYYVYIYNSVTGNIVTSRQLSPGMMQNDMFMKQGILRFTLPGGFRYSTYCFTDVNGISFGDTENVGSAFFSLQKDTDTYNLLPEARKENAYAEPEEFRYDTLSRYIPLVLKVTTDTVRFAPYPARVALLFKLDRSSLEHAIGTAISNLGAVGFVAYGIQTPAGVMDEDSGDDAEEKGIATATRFDGFVTASQSDSDVMTGYGARNILYTGSGNLLDLLVDYRDDPSYGSLGSDIELVIEHTCFPTVVNRMTRLVVIFYDQAGTVTARAYLDLKESDNSIVTLAPDQRRLFIIDKILMLNLHSPEPWDPGIPGGGGVLQ